MSIEQSEIQSNIAPHELLKSKSEAALFWFKFGFQVIPVSTGSKKPALSWDNWLKDLSVEKIKAHWQSHSDDDIGCILDNNVIVFDMDSKESSAALDSIEIRFDLRPNLVVKTSKGTHHYFRRKIDAFANSDSHSTESNPHCIDVKTDRSMIILPPSTNKVLVLKQAVDTSDLVEIGQDFIDAVFIHNGRAAPRAGPQKLSPPLKPLQLSDLKLPRIKALLEHIDPNMGYDDWLHVLMAIHFETRGSEDGFAIADAWSSRGSDYKGSKEIRTKWNSFKHDLESGYTIGTLIMIVEEKGLDWIEICSAVEPKFEVEDSEVVSTGNRPEAIKTEATKASAKSLNATDALGTIQQQFGLISLEGKIWVLDLKSLDERSKEGVAKKLVLSNRFDGSLNIARAVKAQFSQIHASTLVKEFLVSPATIYYKGVDFSPTGVSSDYLNLWVGPTLKPKAGNWELIRSFLLEIICDNDQECYEYLIRYLAHALKRPEEKPEVMVVLLGGQGTGKGTLGRILRRIWSATYLQVINIDAVTGNFNAALERVFIVFMDEALFSGNRKASDALKSLVAEAVIPINEKYQPARQTHSYHRFFAATNADHFKNTDPDDRRDFVLRVSESRKDDHPYWEALHRHIENGGVEAMVHSLLEMDLSNFQVRTKPKTKGLLEQKLQSLDPISRWWHDALVTGSFTDNGEWPSFISTSSALEGILDLAGSKLFKKPTANDVVHRIKKLCPSAENKQQKDGFQRHRGLGLPPLDQARIEFAKFMGAETMTWDPPPSD